jgi:hypothetical protein
LVIEINDAHLNTSSFDFSTPRNSNQGVNDITANNMGAGRRGMYSLELKLLKSPLEKWHG